MRLRQAWAALVTICAATHLAAETPDAVARRYDLAGELLIARGGHVELDRGYGTVVPRRGSPHRAGEHWRLASLSKQVTAALILRAHSGALDQPVAGLGALTLRQLLTHHSGLPDPDATPAINNVPRFYTQPVPDLAYCTSRPSKPGADFHYNNCDYLLAARAFPDALRWPAGMRMARPGDFDVPGFVGGKPEPAFALASFGAAGGLLGTARAVWRFDRALMGGRLLPPAALATLWTPEGGRSYQALGQWVFPATLRGCAMPKRIVQRDGEIEGVQVRNFILPDDDLVVIVFTNRSADDFAIGEIWQQSGFAFDLVSAAACAAGPRSAR